MYDVPKQNTYYDAAGIILVMFKNGRDIFRRNKIMSTEYLNKQILESKAGNVAYSVQEQFYIGSPGASIAI